MMVARIRPMNVVCDFGSERPAASIRPGVAITRFEWPEGSGGPIRTRRRLDAWYEILSAEPETRRSEHAKSESKERTDGEYSQSLPGAPLRRDISRAKAGGDRPAQALWDSAEIFGRGEAGRSRENRPRYVRGAQGPGGDQSARRLRPRVADRRAGSRPVRGGRRPAFHSRDACGRNGRGRRRGVGDPDERPARAARRRSRTRRTDHARAHSSSGRPASGRSRRRRPDRIRRGGGCGPASGLSYQERLSASLARPGQGP